MGSLAHTPPFDRRITEAEYAAVRSWMELLGVQDGYVQDFEAATRDYVPPFDLTGL